MLPVELVSLLPPTDIVITRDRTINWTAIEKDLGIKIPDEYREIVTAYGAGAINGFIWVLSPIEPNPHLDFQRQVLVRINAIKAYCNDYGGHVPYALYPSEGGIVPWGFTENGDVLYWIADDSQHISRIVIMDDSCSEWHEEHCGLGAFLIRFLKGDIACSFFPENAIASPPFFRPAVNEGE